MNVWEPVIAFAAGFVASYVILRWRLKTQYLASRIEDLCNEIYRVGDIAAIYWASDGDADDIKLCEARIIGGQGWVQAAITQLEEDIWLVRDVCAQELVEFSDAISGGDFEVSGRPPDHDRCVRAYKSSTDLIISVRSIRRNLWNSI